MINYKNYGVTIADKHSLNDFGLIMTKKVISEAEPQTNYVTVPGRNGTIDLSEVLTGKVTYQPRKLTITFQRSRKAVNQIVSFKDIQSAWSGNRSKIIFDDDLMYYWLGRPVVKMTNEGKLMTIEVSIDVDPYKYYIEQGEDWLWDPFDFEEGYINETSLTISGTKEVTLICSVPLDNPEFTVSANMTVTVNGTSYSLTKGTQKLYDLFLLEGENNLTFSGNGTVDIKCLGGSL